MGRLTMHMLDTVSGAGAGGIRVDFSKLEDGAYKLVRSITTNISDADSPNASIMSWQPPAIAPT